jgi:nucleotide-binding universal stress UspA family protein
VRRIVAATDASEPAVRGVAFAADLARRFGAILDIITVVPGYDEVLMTFTQADGKAADDAVERIGRVHLEKTLERVDVAGVDVRGAIRVGRPAVELSIYAANTKPDLLVIGGTGHVAQRVIAEATCPVMIVP